MQVMNAEGLTRVQVADRLYNLRTRLKRANRLDGDGNLIGPLKVKA